MKETSGIPLETLQKNFQSNFLVKSFAEISNTSYFKIQDLVKHKVAEAFMSIKDYKATVIVDCQFTAARFH